MGPGNFDVLEARKETRMVVWLIFPWGIREIFKFS